MATSKVLMRAYAAVAAGAASNIAVSTPVDGMNDWSHVPTGTKTGYLIEEPNGDYETGIWQKNANGTMDVISREETRVGGVVNTINPTAINRSSSAKAMSTITQGMLDEYLSKEGGAISGDLSVGGQATFAGHVQLADDFKLQWGGAKARIDGSHTADRLRFFTNDLLRFDIDTSGTATFSGDVDVGGSIAAKGTASASSIGGDFTFVDVNAGTHRVGAYSHTEGKWKPLELNSGALTLGGTDEGLNATFSGDVNVGVDAILNNTRKLIMKDSGGNERSAMFLNNSDVYQIASGHLTVDLNSGTADFHGNDIVGIDSLGINTATPQNRIHIHETSVISPARLQLSNTSSGSSELDGFQLSLASDGTAYILQRENSDLHFYTNNQSRFRIDADGTADFQGNDLTGVGGLNFPVDITFRSSESIKLFYDQSLDHWNMNGNTLTGVGKLTVDGGAKISVQNKVNGGSGHGIFFYDTDSANYGMYMASAGADTSLIDGAACTALDGAASWHIRTRCFNTGGQGFIWENSAEQCLMSLTADTGDLYTKGDVNVGDDLYVTGSIFSNNDTSGTIFGGGTSSDVGGNIVVYGPSNPTVANDILFRSDSMPILRWDDSNSIWNFQGNNITGVGDVTLSGDEINRNQDASALFISGGINNGSGSNIVMFGGAHLLTPNVFRVRTASTTELEFNGTDTWDFQGNALAGVNHLTLSAVGAHIQTNTTDGADDHSIYLAGGGSSSTARGGYIAVHGNEVSGKTGSVDLVPGNPSGTVNVFGEADFQGNTLTGVGDVTLTGNTIQRSVNTSNLILSSGTTGVSGSNLVLYGASHSTNPGDFHVRSGTTAWLQYDSSTNVALFSGTQVRATSYVFSADSNTGMYLDSAETIGFRCNGVRQLVLSQTEADFQDNDITTTGDITADDITSSRLFTNTKGSATAPAIRLDNDGTGNDVGFFADGDTGVEFLGVTVGDAEVARFNQDLSTHFVGDIKAGGAFEASWSTSPNDTTSYFARFTDSTATRAYIWSNGDMQNQNNVYGAISDRRLKRDILPAKSQWDDIKMLAERMVNYRLKDAVNDNPDAPYQLGHIAQEIQEVCPGLVGETNGLLHVKYSIMNLKAIKGLGEAMERIEALEAEISTLKAA